MRTTEAPFPFDFDHWAELASSDPHAFEKKREYTIETAIRQASPGHQQRLRRLQWQLDQIRRTSRTPLAACIRMQRLLWDKLAGETGLLASLEGSIDRGNRSCRDATILPFRRS